jgi:hypothetical protein
MASHSISAQVLLLVVALVISPVVGSDVTWKVLKPEIAKENGDGSSKGKTMKILDDASVETSLDTPNASPVTLLFRFENPTSIRRIRVELLPDSRFKDGRIGRNPDGKRLMLFDIEARMPIKDDVLRRVEWESVEVSEDADDNENRNGTHLIDAASDTGWSIPKHAKDNQPPYAILAFPDAIQFPKGGRFSLTFDVGGHSFDAPARYRISFTDEK